MLFDASRNCCKTYDRKSVRMVPLNRPDLIDLLILRHGGVYVAKTR